MVHCKSDPGDTRLINIYPGLLIDQRLFKSAEKRFGLAKLKNEGKNNQNLYWTEETGD